MQSALRMLFPPQCLLCDAIVERDFALCSVCWGNTDFIEGSSCRTCDQPLAPPADDDLLCDSCLQTPRFWRAGFALFRYRGSGRKLVLALKHGDRHELASPLAHWLAQKMHGKIPQNSIVAPVPLHRGRYFRRKFNQSDLFAKPLANELGFEYIPDLLERSVSTQKLDGLSFDERFTALTGKILVNPKWRSKIENRPVLVVDDVMTSGATLTAATNACISINASEVNVAVLARVAKDT